jgi:hypothetical protein
MTSYQPLEIIVSVEVLLVETFYQDSHDNNHTQHFRFLISPNTCVKNERTYVYATIGSKQTSLELVTLMK